MFEFVSKSDEEIQEIQNRDLLPKGTYAFIVKEIKEGQSKKGDPMLTVRLSVIDNENRARNIFDYLVCTEKMMFKFKHFCEALGLEEDYKNNKLDTLKCIDRSGLCKVDIQKGGMKEDGSGFYPDKNSVQDYIKESIAKPSTEVKSETDFNDDISF